MAISATAIDIHDPGSSRPGELGIGRATLTVTDDGASASPFSAVIGTGAFQLPVGSSILSITLGGAAIAADEMCYLDEANQALGWYTVSTGAILAAGAQAGGAGIVLNVVFKNNP